MRLLSHYRLLYEDSIIMRHTIDFSPLYRHAIGFDQMASMLNSATAEKTATYPPYNVERVEENHYRITMAVAGFSEAQLSITTEHNTLLISGQQTSENDDAEYLYRGIAARNFERKFQLAEHVKVTTARLENGLLHVELEREIPEALRPRTIAINNANDKGELLEQPAA